MADGSERPESMAARERAQAERQERLARAMRENLRRRKAQQRGREPPPVEPVEEG